MKQHRTLSKCVMDWTARPAALVFFGTVVVAAGMVAVAIAAEPETKAKPKAKPNPNASASTNRDHVEHAKKMAKGLDLFKRQVGAILKESCVSCHGEETVEGEFNMTTRAGLLKGGDSGPAVLVDSKTKAVVFGSAKKSLFYKLITHAQEPHMPYEEEKLSALQIEMIRKWIDLGAPYDKPLVDASVKPKDWTQKLIAKDARKFWSFRPLTRPDPPNVKNASRCLSPIDHFIQAKLEKANLESNPPLDRRRLIRRAYFDLIGLPPTPEEIDAFVDDPSPDVYPKLLDRLLASPHYGERWSRHWLDVSRFAESHGFEHDYDRKSAYHFRDFVIQALNDDLPYDTFIKWQLAGDELAPNNNLAMMATGFLAAGVHSTQITANEVEKHRYDELDDMIGTTGTAMLGLTIGCARCHDHKFDPIPQADYYRLLSAFTTTVRSEVELNFDRERYEQAKAVFDRQHAPLAAALNKYETEQLPARFKAWETKRTEAELPKWIVLDIAGHKSKGGATFRKLEDGSILASEKNATHDTYTLVVNTQLKGITSLRLEALSDGSLSKGGPGRAENGNFALTDFRVTAALLEKKSKAVALKLSNARATFGQKGLPAGATIDGDKKSAWSVDPQIGRNHAIAFQIEAASAVIDAGTKLTFTLKFEAKKGHNIGRLRLLATTEPQAVALDAPSGSYEAAQALEIPSNKRSEKQKAVVLRWYRHFDAGWRTLKRRVDDDLKQAPKPNLIKVLVSSEGLKAIRLHSQGADFFKETFFLRRGDPKQKQGAASQGYLQVLMTSSGKEQQWPVAPPDGARTSFRRTALANWMTDTRQGAGHLLARVIVNRLWLHHMGRGIVATPNDFGVRGERPTHPGLLDWLASELVRNDWSMKSLHKSIMMSATYRQSSTFDEKKALVDDSNQLLWRHAHRRLEGEVVRDALLAISDRLDDRMSGPGTLDSSSRRRSVYFTVKRSKLMPMMQVFDAPEALVGIGRRPSTTIAPQALLLMNNPHIRLGATEFAKRLAQETKQSTAQAVRLGFQIAVGRDPSETELNDTVAFIAQQTKSYTADGKKNARELALADFCQVLICLNEFVYVE